MLTLKTITRDQVHEFEIHKFSCEASDIGLPAGHWPEVFSTSIGNGQQLVRSTKKVDDEGDLMWVTYRQLLGCISLRIYND
jgi:hypothetical protein